MKKQSFKSKLKNYEYCEKEILKFSTKKPYSVGEVSEFSATTGIPLYVIYYYIWKTHRIPDAKENMLRMLEYYDLEYDLEESELEEK